MRFDSTFPVFFTAVALLRVKQGLQGKAHGSSSMGLVQQLAT